MSTGSQEVNGTLGFSRLFVINRPSRTDRRDAMALAGAVSNMTLSWIDGLDGDEVYGHNSSNFGGNAQPSLPALGSWRAHLNGLKKIVDGDLESALVMEDDVDWDIKLKEQMQTFGLASRAWFERLIPRGMTSGGDERTSRDLPGILESSISRMDSSSPRSGNIYGTGWDVLWLGHCGTTFPNSSSRLPQHRILIPDDLTVPEPDEVRPHPFALRDPLADIYPPHTRVIHAASGTICSLGYAVSQQGARKLLRQFGTEGIAENSRNGRQFTQWDLMLGDWCGGDYTSIDEPPAVCLTVQPPLISHHYAKGGSSDIQGQGGGLVKKVGTPYIRRSVRMNLGKLVRGTYVEDIEAAAPFR